MAQMINPRPDEIAIEEVAPALEPVEVLVQVHDELSQLRRIVDELCKLVAPLGQPAQLTTVALTLATPVAMQDERGIRTASIAVLNPTGVTILLGIGGGRAASSARAIAVPPESLLVLPVAAGDVEVGTEGDLSAGDAVVHLFRYRTVQPAFLGVSP